MRLATFTHRQRVRLGQVIGDEIWAMAWPDSMISAVRRGMTPSRGSEHFPLASVKLDAPLYPGKILAIGLNYAEHAKETGRAAPREPLVFAKLPSAITGNGDPITWHTSVTKEVDYEGELAVIIGRRASNVSEDQALQHVFGYTCANDVSARDLLGPNEQWTRGKGLDTFCPLGPLVVTRDEIEDPNNLTIKTTVSGEVMQDGSTSDLIFTIPQIIAYLSRHFTLEPGDVILTGTPAGVGMGQKPPRWLKDGDTVTVSIEGIGELTNPCRVIDG